MLITKTSIRSDHENAVFLFLFIKYYRRCNSAFQGIKRSLLFAEINKRDKRELAFEQVNALVSNTPFLYLLKTS